MGVRNWFGHAFFLLVVCTTNGCAEWVDEDVGDSDHAIDAPCEHRAPA